MIKLPNTLTFKLSLWHSSIFLAFLLISFSGLYFTMDSLLTRQVDDDIGNNIDFFQAIYEHGSSKALENEVFNDAKENDEGDFIRVFSTKGETLYSTNLRKWKDISIDKNIVNRVLKTKDTQFITLTRSDDKGNARIAYGFIDDNLMVQVGESTEEQDDLLSLLIVTFSIIFILIIPVASIGGYLISRKAVSGIQHLSRVADKVRQGELDARSTLLGAEDEVQLLGDTFNSMLDKIRNLVTEMREITDNIAHDLRSPIARIRAHSESTLSDGNEIDDYKSSALKTIEECDRLVYMINAALEIAEVEAGAGNNKIESIDLVKLAADACDLFEPVAEEKSISLSFSFSGNEIIQGNIANMQRMLSNLIDNAIKFTGNNGDITVRLESNNDQVSITVEDTGEGIDTKDLNHVFDRFYRCDKSRTHEGNGLGLSFSRAVARAHGGDIAIKSTLNIGSIFIISLPLNS